MGDRCDVQIDAQTNREVEKIRPHSDSATAQMMLDGLSMADRADAQRQMKEALERELNKKPQPVELDQKGLAKEGIKVDGDIMTFPNGLKFNSKTHKVEEGDHGKWGGIFMTKEFDEAVYQKGQDGKLHATGERQHIKEYYKNATDRLAYSDTAGILLHVPAKDGNGQYIVDQSTGKVTYQQDHFRCGQLPQLTLEDAKKANKEVRDAQDKKDLERPWDQ